MRVLLPLISIAVFVCACIPPREKESVVAPGPSLALVCPDYDGMAPVAALAESRVIIFGEAIHGTNESPAAFFALTCYLAKQGQAVRIGLEATHTQSEALDAFLNHPDDSATLRLKTDDMWSVHDGRSSEAILLLLNRLADLRANGADVSVFAFDAHGEEWVSADSREIARDAAMAKHVDEAAAGYDGAVLLLTGGFHARKEPFSLGDLHFVPMATGITSRPVLSLEMRHAGGSGWMIGEVDGEPFKGAIVLNNLLPEGLPVRAFRLESPSAAYDGIYFTGPITASPPAFP